MENNYPDLKSAEILPNNAVEMAEFRYRPLSFALVSLIIVFISYQLIGGGITYLFMQMALFKDSTAFMRSATMIGEFLFLLVPALILAYVQHKKTANIVSWRMPGALEILSIVIGIISLQFLLDSYVYFQDMIPLPDMLRQMIDQLKQLIEGTYRRLVETHSAGEFLFVIMVVSVTPSLCEEYLFRGLIQKNLSAGTGPIKGFILTGVIFALYHFNPFLLLPLIAIGIYLSYIMFRSGTILIPMIAHFTNNSLSTVAAHLQGMNAESPAAAMILGDQSISAVAVFSVMAVSAFVFILSLMMYHRVTGGSGSSRIT